MKEPTNQRPTGNGSLSIDSIRNACSYGRRWFITATCLIVASMNANTQAAPPLDFESEPIQYSESEPKTILEQLNADLANGKKTLRADREFGYLPDVLRELEVPKSSQMLTFLKSSMQRRLIGPQNPRAIFFNDDAYVGYVPGGIIEMIVPDANLGLVFYTLDPEQDRPRFEHQVSRCMTCHASSRTRNIPGLQVRSMMTDPAGQPVLSAGSYRTDHATPLSKRWGGWFVSGTHGKAKHLGNFQLPSSDRPKQPVDNTNGQNVIDLASKTDLTKCFAPHSDIVALMVFEHQIDAHNLMVRTHFAYQLDRHAKREDADDAIWKDEANALVEQLTFHNEHRLESPIHGVSDFAVEFAKRGPYDSKGHSLREFDLTTRLFRYPCSYTVHSQLFSNLPATVKRHVIGEIVSKLSVDSATADSQAARRFATQEMLQQLLPLEESLPHPNGD